MKRGIIHTLIYYGASVIVFFILSAVFEQPAHYPGINFFFLFFVFLIACCMILINLIRYLSGKTTRMARCHTRPPAKILVLLFLLRQITQRILKIIGLNYISGFVLHLYVFEIKDCVLLNLRKQITHCFI